MTDDDYEPRIDVRNPGTQKVLPVEEIGPPDYPILRHEFETCIELLLDQAVDIGERHSQSMIRAGRGPAPHAHRACNSYHAIEIIRSLEARIAQLEAIINQAR